MIIEKSIEILTTFTFASNHTSRNDVNDAIRLGIEALKQLQSCRLCCQFASEGLLPGETKE